MSENQVNEETLPDDVARQVVGYMKHQAAKPAADLLALVDRAEDGVERSLEGVSESQARFCPEPGEWCICEVLYHVRAAMDGNARIVETLIAGEKADLKGIEPVVEAGSETLAELRKGVAQSFEHLRATVRSIPEGAEPAATAGHPFFGELTGKEWVAFAYVHARDHAEQIEAVKANPDFPG